MNLQQLIMFHKAQLAIAHTDEVKQMHNDAISFLTSLQPSADIAHLPGRAWNAHAVLHDVLGQIEIDSPVVVLWIDKNELVRFRQACTEMQKIYMGHKHLFKV